MKKNKVGYTSLIYWLLFVILFVSIVTFIFKFKSLPFLLSQPSDWNIFVSYLSGIIIPVLTFLNLIIFIKLTKSIQRASENKSWVERTEKLIFDFIDSISKEASYLAINVPKLKKDPNLDPKIFFDEIVEMKKNVQLFNNDITEKEFKLRIFVESDIFSNCKTRESFKKTTNDLMQNINNFLTAFSLPKNDKSTDLQESFKVIERSLRNMVKEAKQFCDEIYHMEY